MKFKVEVEREKDGRWIAEIRELPGCIVYGKTPDDVLAKVKALAVRVHGQGYADLTIKKQGGTLRRILSSLRIAQRKLVFNDGQKIGPRMLSRIAKRVGKKPEAL